MLVTEKTDDQLARGGNPGDPERGLDGRSTVALEAYGIHAGHRRAQFIGKLDFAIVRRRGLHPEFELRGNGGIDIGVGMAEQHGAEATHVVDVLAI